MGKFVQKTVSAKTHAWSLATRALLLFSALTLSGLTFSKQCRASSPEIDEAENNWAAAQVRYVRELRKNPGRSSADVEKLKQTILDPSRKALEDAYFGVRRDEIAALSKSSDPVVLHDQDDGDEDDADSKDKKKKTAKAGPEAEPQVQLDGSAIDREVSYSKRKPQVAAREPAAAAENEGIHGLNPASLKAAPDSAPESKGAAVSGGDSAVSEISYGRRK